MMTRGAGAGALGALLLGLLSCKAKPAPFDETLKDAGPASVAGDAIAWTTADGVHLRRDGVEKHVALTPNDCHPGGDTLLRDVSLLYLFPDARRALVHGARPNVDFDLFGHAGRRLTASCLVDFDRGTAVGTESALPGSELLRESRFIEPRLHAAGPRVWLWAAERPIELIDTARGEHVTVVERPTTTTRCQVQDSGAATASVVCLGQTPSGAPGLRVRTFDVASWPPAPRTDATFPVSDASGPFAVSPDGSRAAFVMQPSAVDLTAPIVHRTMLVTLADGATTILDDQTWAGRVVALTFDPQGRGVWLGEQREVDGPGRIRLVDMKGTTTDDRRVAEVPYGLVLTRSGTDAWSIPPVSPARRIRLRAP